MVFLICFFLFVGVLLYLPFFLWFRHRRRVAPTPPAEDRFTRVGYAFLVVQIATMLFGFGAGVLQPQSTLGSLTQGYAGFARWSACVYVVFSVLAMMLRSWGFSVERPRAAASPSSTAATTKTSGNPGRLKIATVRGVPVFIHWSLPLGGLLIACIAQPGVLGSVVYCLAFAVLIAIHEFGHVLAARLLGLKVFAIEISGVGGTCRVQVPRSARDTLFVYAAGLAAQVVLLLLTLLTAWVTGEPDSTAGRSVFITFTDVNAVLFVINLIPTTIRAGLSTDGGVLWGLLLHVLKRRPHPLARLHEASPLFPPATRLLTIDGLTPEGFTTGIEILNDDSTPMEFVIEMLEKHLKLERDAAVASALRIHTQGGLLWPLAGDDHAEAVADAVTRDSRDRGHRLVCRAVDARSA